MTDEFEKFTIKLLIITRVDNYISFLVNKQQCLNNLKSNNSVVIFFERLLENLDIWENSVINFKIVHRNGWIKK